jgi:hypothetical protein
MEIIIAHIMQESKKADDPKTKIPTGLLYASDASRSSATHQHHKLTDKTQHLHDPLHANGWTQVVRLRTTHQANTQIHTIRMKMIHIYNPSGKQIEIQQSFGLKTLLIKTMDENIVLESAIVTTRTINMMTEIQMTTDLTHATTQITMTSVIHDPLLTAHREDKGAHRYQTRSMHSVSTHRSIDAPDQM